MARLLFKREKRQFGHTRLGYQSEMMCKISEHFIVVHKSHLFYELSIFQGICNLLEKDVANEIFVRARGKDFSQAYLSHTE